MPRDPATHVGAVVLIDGVEVPCDPDSLDPGVLSGLRVTWGRSDRLTKPAASTCDFDMIDPDGGKTDHGAVVGYASSVEVLAVSPSGQRARVFYGLVTDLSLDHESGPDARLSVTAADPTTSLADVMVGDTPWPAQSPAARRSAIMSAVGTGVISWYAMPSYTPTVTMAARDVDNQSLWDVVTEFLWSLGIVPWPVAHDGDNLPGVVMTGGTDPDLAYGVIDTRPHRRISLADFNTGNYTTPKAIRTVVLDACDIDLEGTTFAANPADILQTIRITWGDEDSEQKHIVRQGGDSGGTADNPAGRVFDTTARVTSGVGNIVPLWQYQMADWGTHFTAPWAVDTLTVDPDAVTGADDFHRGLLRLLGQTTRVACALVLQNLPSWTPWRRWVPRKHHPHVAGTVQGGTYSFTDGRWVLELKATVDRALEGDLAPLPTLTVKPGDVVDVPHDAPGVTPVPDTRWPGDAWATFTDGHYRWDGAAWHALTWDQLPAGLAWQDVPAGTAWTDNPLTEGA